MKPLIIVESFTKTKTIAKYLDDKYNVICSLGHINNLPKDDVGIDIQTWKGTFVPTNPKIIKNIRDHVKQTDVIYIASDPDMEGEAIAHHIYNNISDLVVNKKCHRIEFYEITKNAIINAINSPRNINNDIVDAQETRRFVDRLVGYKLSPLLWNKFHDNTLSVGRVQSISLLLCVNVLQKIQEHKIEPYWTITGYFDASTNVIDFKLYDNEKNIFKTNKSDRIRALLDDFKFDLDFKLSISETNAIDNPAPPYTTTTLQQDAYNKHRFSSKKTMQLSQQLYENGLITYMRTDSNNISNDFKNEILKYVRTHFGDDNAKFRNHKNNIANAQIAHEAIRITNVKKTAIDISPDLNKLYNLIWKRTVASQMKSAEYRVVEVSIQYPHNKYVFIHKKSLLVDLGYLTIYNSMVEDVTAYKKHFDKLYPLKFLCEADTNTPPTLYNEISLIKALEKEGIGRPSTYSSIVEKIIAKKYVIKGSNPQKTIVVKNIIKTPKSISEVDSKINIGGKSKDLLMPTDSGINVISYLKQEIPFLLDIKFTSNMETAMDKICDKSISKTFVLNDFYNNHISPLVSKTISCDSGKKEMKTGIVKTKYGYCYYNEVTKKFTNIESYLKWKKITTSQLTDTEVQFLASLPRKLEDGTFLHIGPYGLYLKDQNKNVKLDKNKWDSYVKNK